MKRQWKTALFLAIVVLATVIFGVLKTGPAATAANPTTMSFQGKVVNADGTNVIDANYSFLFKLYTVSSAGTAIWTETQSTVTVTAGVFQVNLGVNCPLFTANACNGSTPIDFNANPNMYLGITFNGDVAGEMTPRVQLQSVPFAFNSDKVGGFTAAQLVQLSPGSQQAGFINVSGAGTFGGNLAVTGTYNTNTFNSSSLTFGATATASVQAATGQALNVTGNAASTISTTAGNLTLQGGSGTVTLGSSTNLTATGALTLDSGTTTALGVGTGANAKTITFGNVTGATGLVFNSGTAGATFNSVAGGQLLVTSGTNIPTTDQLRISNIGSTGVTTAGVNGLSISYRGGAAAVESAAQRIDLTTGSTAGVGAIWSGLRVVGAAPSTGVTENLFKGETAAFTQVAANTTNINGFNLPIAGALVQNTAAGTINWDGVNLTTPTITQTTGVVAVNGVQVTVPSSAITTGGTINGFSIPTIATGPAAGILTGINIGAITTPGAGTEIAIKIGNGWDTAIDIGTGFIKSNGFNGLTQTGCAANQTLNGIVVRGGIVTAGNCANNLTDIAEQYNSLQPTPPTSMASTYL